MDSRIRTAWYCFVVVTSTIIILLGAFSIFSDDVIAIVPNDELFDYDHRLHVLVNALPRCATNCIVPRITDHDCTHSDYVCICHKFQALGDPCTASNDSLVDFKTCMDECAYADQWSSPGLMIDICNAVDVRVVLPDFMLGIFKLRGRQFSTSFDDLETTTKRPSKTTPYVTTTSTMPLGADETSYNTGNGNPTTTVVIGVTAGAAASTSTSASKIGFSRGKSGLSSAAKIGIGVAIPVAVILIVVFVAYIWRRRKGRSTVVPEARAERNVGDLPEVAELGIRPNTRCEYPNNPDDYKHVTALPGIHELNEKTSSGGLAGTSGASLHELNDKVSSPKVELTDVDSVRIELPDMTAYTTSSPMGSNSGSPPAATPSSFPPPWESSIEQNYVAYQNSYFDGLPVRANTVLGVSGGRGYMRGNEDDDIRELEEEMARVRERKERLQSLQALEEREEQLRKIIEDRRRGGASSLML